MVEAVQRWRIAFRRAEPALGLGPAEIARAWEDGLVGSGIPVLLGAAARPRPKLTFALPLPAGRPAEHDLADLILTERWPLARFRRALVDALPAGFALVELYDVWLGAPTISGAVAAAAYRGRLDGLTEEELARASGLLLAASELSRVRPKGDGQARYDLRPLIVDLAAHVWPPSVPAGVPGSGPGMGPASEAVLRMLLRASSDGPSGRPEEVALAIGERLGRTLRLVDLVRERVWTADEAASLSPATFRGAGTG
jgi:radical SAM-linked protein